MFKFVLQFSSYALVLGFVMATSFNECSQRGLLPEEVNIDGCESSTEVCNVKFNGDLNMTMKFKASHYMESMVPTLSGRSILGDFNLTVESDYNTDVCVGILNTVCPLVAQEIIEYEYSTKLLVLPLLPITLKFSIIDTDLNETALCFTTDLYPSRW